MAFSIWWLIPAFVGLVGILMLVGGVGRVFKAQFVSGVFRVLFGGLTLAGAAIVGLIGLNLQTYVALSKERVAGKVTLKKVGDFNYVATIDLADNGKFRNQPSDYQVTGEIVNVGGPVVKFKPWANVIGMDSIFRVETVGGSYFDVDCNNLYQPRTESAAADEGADLLKLLGESWKLLNATDVIHESTSGQAMGDGAVYLIKATQGAFELEPDPNSVVAQDLQKALLTRSGATCSPVTTPVQTPAGEVQYAPPAPANAPPEQNMLPPAQTSQPPG
jgi:hypothetical protein